MPFGGAQPYTQPRAIHVLVCLQLLATVACDNGRPTNIADRSNADTCSFLAYGQRKVAYHFGRMTADKGLKLYRDTATLTLQDAYLQDSLWLLNQTPQFKALHPMRVTCAGMANIVGMIVNDS